MSDTERMFSEYVQEHLGGGEADPRGFLQRAPAADRRELAALIDAYLASAPRRKFSAQEFRGSSSERTVDALERVLSGRAGVWPALLPQLRHRAGLKRSQLVERLAARLGVDQQAAKVGVYYHQMEQGLLPAAGVADRVLAALGEIVGETAQTLREAGRPHGGGSPPAPGAQPAFARRTHAEAAAVPPPAPRADAADADADAAEWDEVDELFRGG